MIWVVIVIDDGSNDSVGIGMLINMIMVIISIVAVVEFRVGSGVVVAVIAREIDGSTLMIHRFIG